MILLDGRAVRRHLPYPVALLAAREALMSFSAGRVQQPLRTVIRGGEHGVFGAMPVQVLDGPAAGFGVKTVVVKHGNAARGLPSHVGFVLLFDADTGRPTAALDAAAVTEIRTAACSAVATAALAGPAAGEVAVLGTGAQARAHLQALLAVRPLDRVRVWGRDAQRAERFCGWAVQTLGLDTHRAASPAEAARGAGIICTTTAACEPLLSAADITAGAHINAVGACQPGFRELAGDLMASATVLVDSRESALAESDELRQPMREGLFGPEHVVAEVGEVLLGSHPGRRDPQEVTVFDSVGLAVLDVFAAWHATQAARRSGGEQELDLT